MQVFYPSIYFCTAIGDPIIKRERVGIPIIGLTPPHFCTFPKQDLDFQSHMSWSFLCSLIWGERWLFCWYWWNCWTSLFKGSFHNAMIGLYIIQWNLSKANLIWTNFCVQFIQVKLIQISYIRTLFKGLYRILVYPRFGLYRILVYSGFWFIQGSA